MRNRTLPPLSLITLLSLATVGGAFLLLTGDAGGAYHAFQAFCLDTLETANARVPLFPGIVLLVPLVVAGTAIASVAQQVLATHRLVHALLEHEVVPIDQRLRRAAIRVGIDDQIRLVASAEFFAFCFGWLRPAVCVSTATVTELSPAELEAVLRHESWHVCRKDPLRVLMVKALGSALSVVPVVRDLARHYILKIELRADHAAVQAMGDAHPLAAALYRATTRVGTLLPAVGAFNATNARIDQLLGEEVPTFGPRPVDIVLSLIVFAGLLLLLCFSAMAVSVSGMVACIRC